MTETPCRYCTDRDPYCHCTCQKYKDWKVVYEAEKAAKAKARAKCTWTYAQRKAYWAASKRDIYKNCTKQFRS